MKAIGKKWGSLMMAVLLFVSVPVLAADTKKQTNTAVRFYVECLDAQDGLMLISNVSSSLRKDIKLDADFTLSVGGEITQQTMLSYITKTPEIEKVLKKIQQTFQKEGYVVYAQDGTRYPISDLTPQNFDVEWNYMYFDSHWHINGRIIDLATNQPVYIGKADGQPATPQYTSNFAYIFGYNDTTMGAQGNLLRGEVCAMIHRLAKQNDKRGGFVYNASKPPVYEDIAGEWFRSAIEYLEHRGAFDTKKGGNIYPYAAVTRGETFKLLCIGLGFTSNPALTVDDYAQIMKNAGYIQGDENGSLNVSDLITRAEFCAIYNRVIGREDAGLVTKDGEKITAETYGFKDLTGNEWYYETMLKATSAYDEDGYVDIALRAVRNDLDDYQ